MGFREDLELFAEKIKGSDEKEIKSEYRKLIKKYHPDLAEPKDRDLFNEYIVIINKLYLEGKTETKETVIEKNQAENYVFRKTGVDGKIYCFKCRNFEDYLYKTARAEYDKGHAILHFSDLNHLDKKAVDQNSLEVMRHYENALKCYKYLLKNGKDEVILGSAEFDVELVQDGINKLSRTIAASDEKGIAVV